MTEKITSQMKVYFKLIISLGQRQLLNKNIGISVNFAMNKWQKLVSVARID